MNFSLFFVSPQTNASALSIVVPRLTKNSHSRFIPIYKHINYTEKNVRGVFGLSKIVEIRWHGRGGQGAKTAALLLSDAAFEAGKYIQGFPEYGPERMGAPITAYNRFSDEKIRMHSNIYEPDFVVVVDDTLLDVVDVTAGLKADGAVVVNTQTPEKIKDKLRGYSGKVYAVDAKEISISALGKYFPNFPMLGAINAVSGVMEKEAFTKAVDKLIDKKFASKAGVAEGNKKALARGMAEVKEV